MMINKLTKAALLLQSLTQTKPINRIFQTSIASYSWTSNVKSKDFLNSETKSRINLTKNEYNLWSILKSRSKIKKSSPIEETIHLCKKVTGYYNRVNKHEFLKAQDEINRIVEDLRSMQLGDQPHQTYCNILDFIDVVISIFGKNENSSNLKDIVFMKFAESIKIENIAFSEQSRIYASLAKNKYPKLQEITDIILSTLKKGDKKLQSYIIQKIIIGISSRSFLNSKQTQILKIVLAQINQQIKQITPKCIGLTFHIIESLELRAILNEQQIALTIDNLEKYLTLFIQNVKFGDQTLVYFLNLDFKIKKKSIIFEQIWRKVLKSIEAKSQSTQIMKILTATLQKLYDHEHTKEQKLLIANYLKQSYSNKQTKAQVFSEHSAEKTLMNLFQGGLIDSTCIDAYNSIVSANTFTVYWSHLQCYTKNGLAFPEKKLVDFLTKSKKFMEKQNTIAKAAVIIPIQAQYYPLNDVIQDFNKNIVRMVADYTWNAHCLNWMLQQIAYDFFIMKNFHQKYQHHFMDKIKKTLIESNEASIINYYLYVFEMESKHNIKKEMIQAVTESILQSLMVKQHTRSKKRINKSLISTIIYKINSGSIHFNSNTGKEIMKLVSLYSNIFWKEEEAAVNEYISLLEVVIKHHSLLVAGANEFNQALKKLLSGKKIKSQKFYNSIYYLELLQTLNKELPSIRSKSNDSSLIEVIEKSLEYPHSHFNTAKTVSPKATLQIIAQQLTQNKATPEDLKAIIQSVKALSFNEIERLIITKFKKISKSTLQNEIISSYMKKFSFVASNNRWKIILFSNFISNDQPYTQLKIFVHKIIEKLPMQDTYYKDHLFLLNYIARNGMNMMKYKLALYKHLSARYHTEKHNAAYLELLTQLSLFVEFDNEIVELLLNQMDTNPHNQIKLIAIFQNKILQKKTSKDQNAIFSILSSVVNNSLVSIKPSIFLSYFEALSLEDYKKTFLKHINNNHFDDSIRITKSLTTLDRKILDVLEKKDKVIKQTFGKENFYIFNKFIILFSSSESAEISRILKVALKKKYGTHHFFTFTKCNKREVTDFLNMANLANSTVNLTISDFFPEEAKANPI